MSDNTTVVHRSQFANTYGSLILVKHNDTGALFLVMEDCRDDSVFGPLTPAQLAAFWELENLKQCEGSFT